MKRKHVITILVIAGAVFLTMLMATDPAKLSSLALIVPFLLLFTVLWCGAFLLLRASHVSRARSVRLSFVGAGLPIGLMLLQSIGQLTFRDVITILMFFAVAYFYIDRITVSKQSDI